MAGRGPAPQKNRSRQRDTAVRDVIKSDGKIGGFPLPDDVLPYLPARLQPDPENPTEREQWNPQTVRWWENWRESPQATRMATAVDWDFLLDTALMHHVTWESGGRNSERLAEIRVRVAKFGATLEDRMRLKQEIEIPEEYSVGNEKQGDAVVTDLNARRTRLSGG